MNIRSRNIAAAIVALACGAAPFAFAYASVSVSIGSLSPSTTISVGTNLSLSLVASGFSSPTYSVSDSASGGTSVSSGDINGSGNFSWTPASNDVGTHNLTFTVSDSSGDNATTEETIIVSQAPSVAVSSLSPSTSITTGQSLTFNVVATGFNSPTYSLSDSFGGSSVTNSDINSSGNFTWTPDSNDVGTHAITINVNDSSGHSISTNVTITVSNTSSPGTTGTGGATVQGLSPGTSVVIGNPVTFTVAASGFSSPAFSLSDSFSGSTLSNADINSAGYFSWTPTQSDVGTHNITLYVNDSSGHTGNVSLALTVNAPNIAITTINPGTSVLPNSTLTFTVSPQGFVNPAYALSDSFSGTTLTNSNINSSGQFSWTPATSQEGSHTITVSATDSEGHSANTSITIDVSSGTETVPTTTTSSDSLAALEAQLAADESELGSLGGSTAASSGFTFQNELLFGMTSSDVTQLQTLLTTEGFFSGPISGYYGSLTQAAVEQFQTAHGIAAVGYVGPATRTALNALLSSSGGTTTATSAKIGDGYEFENFIGYGDTSTDVTELQERLAAFGDYSGPVTGYFGSLTQQAVEEFQQKNGIEQAGYVGPATRAALNQ